MPDYPRRPRWLKPKPLDPDMLASMSRLMRGLKLHTVCQSARCPNRTECFAQGTAAFMILGDICTRNCAFCAVKKGTPSPPDLHEPEHVVEAVQKLGLGYVVVTSVTRDDLADGGASHFARTIESIRSYDVQISVEVLIPDFKGSTSALQTVIEASPTVINHNMETVPRLYPEVRPQAKYQRSLALLKRIKSLDSKVTTKSGLMLGLGESRQEVIEVMADLRGVGCDFLTIGQYLQPSLKHHQVVRYVHEDEFKEYQNLGREMGFNSIIAGPLVRSSFNAAKIYAMAR